MFLEPFQFHIPTKLLAGPGITETLGSELDALGIKSLFVVTDRYLYQSGMVANILKGLEGWGGEEVSIFDEVTPNSGLAQVDKGVYLAREKAVDGIIAIGGGSVIDTAKAINLLISHGGNLLDYEGYGTVPGPLKPLIAVPTTAGTGSEATIFAVIRDEINKTKLTFSDPHLIPALALLDPNLTVSLPQKLTAATGIDALTHAIEAYLSNMHNPISDTFALQAVRLIKENLITAVENGNEIEARHGMLVASTMAGIAFSSSMVGCVHALAHAVGGQYEVPHGEANALFLPYGMELQIEDVPERMAKLAEVLGEETKEASAKEAAKLAIKAVKELIKECGLFQKMQQLGIPEEAIAEIAEKALCDGSMLGCERMPDLEEVEELLKKAY